MSKWIPTPAYPDMMPIDISFVFEDEKPAGKHGFLKTVGNHFQFEDGTRTKFWGVCLAGAANFPEHDYARQLAQRLAQSGCNCVRMHWMDTEFDTPNIFSFSKGKRVQSTRTLDPKSLDRLDYLIYSLKNEGIYIYLDNLTFRKFKSGDGVPYANELSESAKPYSIFNRRLIELQKEYITNLWTHHNPYTDLDLKDDPAILLTEITNETDIFSKNPWAKSDYYENEFRNLFKDWLKKNNIQYDWQNCDLYEKDDTIIEFKVKITESYFNEMRDHMRSIGIKVPITGTTWYHNAPGNVKTNMIMDYTDSHHYYYDWRWDGNDKICSSEQINGYPFVCPNLTVMRTATKPFFVSEWDMPWPNDYRAEGPIYYSAICALQDWDGMGLFGYSHGSHLDRMKVLGSEFSTDYIGGIPFEAGVLSSWNDPSKFGLFYHCALIVRRGDISPADKKIAVKMDDLKKFELDAAKTGLEVHRLMTVLSDEEASECDELVSPDTKFEQENPDIIISDNGQMKRYLSKKVGIIDTPRTKIVYGRLTKYNWKHGYIPFPETSFEGLSVKAQNDFGIIALSSLTNEPTEKSDNMLLTTIGRSRNTDMSGIGDEIIDIGHEPIISEVIEAEIKIKTERTDLRVCGVNPEGYYVGPKKVTFEDGYMRFNVGDKCEALYYLIFAE